MTVASGGFHLLRRRKKDCFHAKIKSAYFLLTYLHSTCVFTYGLLGYLIVFLQNKKLMNLKSSFVNFFVVSIEQLYELQILESSQFPIVSLVPPNNCSILVTIKLGLNISETEIWLLSIS